MRERPTRYILKKNNIDRPYSGFTLIELLITASIVAVIGLAVYSSLVSGVRIWQRLNQKEKYEDLAFFFDRFGYDLRNCFNYSTIKFSGTEKDVSFASWVSSQRLEKKTVGEIGYFYSKDEGLLERRERDYSHIYNDGDGLVKTVLSGIKHLEFGFYVYDQPQKKYLWLEEFDQDDLPLSVRLEIELDDVPEKIVRTFNIPLKLEL